MPRLLLAAALLLPAAPAAALDCASPTGPADSLVCADPALTALDTRLAARFAAALPKAAAEGPAAESALRSEHAAWSAARDDCWQTENPRACVENRYLRREARLVATWSLKYSDSITYWTCDNRPGNLIAALFYATELPAVRLEYGNETDIGTLVRSASGSRFIASEGREFWIRGNEARLIWPAGTEQTCALQK